MKRLARAAAWLLLCPLTAGVGAAQSPPCPVGRLAVDPFNASALYATSSGRLFGSTDGGSTWRLLFSGVSQTPTIDPRDSQHLLLSTGKGLIESQDGGRTWTELAVPALPGFAVLFGFGSVEIDPFDRGTLYVVGSYHAVSGIMTPNLLHKSVDRGQSWSPLLNGEPGMTAPVLDRSSAGSLLIGIFGNASYPAGSSLGGGVLMSRDGGSTWSTSLESFPSGPWCRDLVADPVDPGILYAEISCYTYRTSDGGNTWQVFQDVFDCRVDDLVSGPSEVFANGTAGVLISRTGSLSWQPFLPPGNTMLAVDPSNRDVLYVRNGSALLKSIDGGRTLSVLCGVPDRPEVPRVTPRAAARPVRERP